MRLVGVLGGQAVISARNRDGIGVCMNYRRFVVIPVFLMARPYMYVLVGRHEKRLQQGKQRRCGSETLDHGAIIQPQMGSWP